MIKALIIQTCNFNHLSFFSNSIHFPRHFNLFTPRSDWFVTSPNYFGKWFGNLGDKNKKLSARAYFLDITPNFTHYLTRKCIYSKRMKNQFLCLSERVNLCGIHRSNNSMKRNSVIIVEALHFYCCEKNQFSIGCCK